MIYLIYLIYFTILICKKRMSADNLSDLLGNSSSLENLAAEILQSTAREVPHQTRGIGSVLTRLFVKSQPKEIDNNGQSLALNRAAAIRAKKKEMINGEVSSKFGLSENPLIDSAVAEDTLPTEASDLTDAGKAGPRTTTRRKSQSLFRKDSAYSRAKSSNRLVVKEITNEKVESSGCESFTPQASDLAEVSQMFSRVDDFCDRLEVNAAEADLLETVFQYTSDNICDMIASIRVMASLLRNQIAYDKRDVSEILTQKATWVGAVSQTIAGHAAKARDSAQSQVAIVTATDIVHSHSSIFTPPEEIPVHFIEEQLLVPEENESPPAAAETLPTQRGRRLSVVPMKPLIDASLLKEKIIGDRIKIMYNTDDGDEAWADGIVVDYYPDLGRHEIVFEDGLRMDVDLSVESVLLETLTN